MQVLLDTHLLLWAVGDPDRLDSGLVQLLEDPMNTPVFSVVSLWEVVIKSALDRPDFRVEPSLLRQVLVEARHMLAVAQLPALHRDPFDRLLLAQAQADGLLLITADQQLAQYPGPVRRMG